MSGADEQHADLRFGINVSDLDRSTEFYTRASACRRRASTTSGTC
jgi:hypothetical protein